MSKRATAGPTPETPFQPEPGSYADRIRQRMGPSLVEELLAHLPRQTTIWSQTVHATRSATIYYWLRTFAANPGTAPECAPVLGEEYRVADRTYYMGHDVCKALGCTWKQTDVWMGWKGDTHPARAVALLSEVLYGNPDSLFHRSLS